MMNIENLLKAYETDANDPKGLGRFEVLNMLNNRDVLEEHKSRLTTLQAARLLFCRIDNHLWRWFHECPG
jgi:hypothetical protein